MSERTASSAENSTSSVYWRARLTICAARSSTCSGVMRNLCCMWIGLVAIKVWMRPRAAGLMASAARSMSFSTARARPHTVLSLITLATAFTASKSPGLAAGKPASMISTRMRSSALAMRTFSSWVMDAPGLCSPSRSVVSKIIKRSVMAHSLCTALHAVGLGSGVLQFGVRIVLLARNRGLLCARAQQSQGKQIEIQAGAAGRRGTRSQGSAKSLMNAVHNLNYKPALRDFKAADHQHACAHPGAGPCENRRRAARTGHSRGTTGTAPAADRARSAQRSGRSRSPR